MNQMSANNELVGKPLLSRNMGKTLLEAVDLNNVQQAGRNNVLERDRLVQPIRIQLIGMSATVGNIKVIAAWFGGKLYVSEYRPVQLQELVVCGWEVLSCDGQLRAMLFGSSISTSPPPLSPPSP